MELTNREKLIISWIIISRQNRYPLGQNRKTELLEHFTKAFDINEKELVKDIFVEQDQFMRIMNDLVDGNDLNVDCLYSNLDNREKFIFYNVGFLMQYLDDFTYRTLVHQFTILFYPMPTEKVNELLNLVKNQIDSTFAYIEYVLSNKSFK